MCACAQKNAVLDAHMYVHTGKYDVLAKNVRTSTESACPYPPADLHLVRPKHKVRPVRTRMQSLCVSVSCPGSGLGLAHARVPIELTAL